MEAEVYVSRSQGKAGEAESQAQGHSPAAISLMRTVSHIPEALRCCQGTAAPGPRASQAQQPQRSFLLLKLHCFPYLSYQLCVIPFRNSSGLAVQAVLVSYTERVKGPEFISTGP